MLNYDKALIGAIRQGLGRKEELVRKLLRDNSVFDLAEGLADFLIANDEVKPITVSQEEYDRITGLFKIRGLKPDGSIENRGKKK